MSNECREASTAHFLLFRKRAARSSEKRSSRARGLALFGVVYYIVHLKVQYQRRQAICLSLSLPLWPRMREQPSHPEIGPNLLRNSPQHDKLSGYPSNSDTLPRASLCRRPTWHARGLNWAEAGRCFRIRWSTRLPTS